MISDFILVVALTLEDYNAFIEKNNHLSNRCLFVTNKEVLDNYPLFDLICLDKWALREDFFKLNRKLACQISSGQAKPYTGVYYK